LKNLTPVQTLVGLILVGFAISGWFYGLRGRSIAEGNSFTNDEKLIIQLQDQIRALSETNIQLNDRIKSLSGGEVTPEVSQPVLPGRPVKIETH
jgi:cell division protein FtsB